MLTRASIQNIITKNKHKISLRAKNLHPCLLSKKFNFREQLLQKKILNNPQLTVNNINLNLLDILTINRLDLRVDDVFA